MKPGPGETAVLAWALPMRAYAEHLTELDKALARYQRIA